MYLIKKLANVIHSDVRKMKIKKLAQLIKEDIRKIGIKNLSSVIKNDKQKTRFRKIAGLDITFGEFMKLDESERDLLSKEIYDYVFQLTGSKEYSDQVSKHYTDSANKYLKALNTPLVMPDELEENVDHRIVPNPTYDKDKGLRKGDELFDTGEVDDKGNPKLIPLSEMETPIGGYGGPYPFVTKQTWPDPSSRAPREKALKGIDRLYNPYSPNPIREDFNKAQEFSSKNIKEQLDIDSKNYIDVQNEPKQTRLRKKERKKELLEELRDKKTLTEEQIDKEVKERLNKEEEARGFTDGFGGDDLDFDDHILHMTYDFYKNSNETTKKHIEKKLLDYFRSRRGGGKSGNIASEQAGWLAGEMLNGLLKDDGRIWKLYVSLGEDKRYSLYSFAWHYIGKARLNNYRLHESNDQSVNELIKDKINEENDEREEQGLPPLTNEELIAKGWITVEQTLERPSEDDPKTTNPVEVSQDFDFNLRGEIVDLFDQLEELSDYEKVIDDILIKIGIKDKEDRIIFIDTLIKRISLDETAKKLEKIKADGKELTENAVNAKRRRLTKKIESLSEDLKRELQKAIVDNTNYNFKPIIELTNNKIMENSEPNTVVGKIQAINLSKGNISISLVNGKGGEDNDKFEIVENNLILKTPFDLSTDKTNPSIRVRVTQEIVKKGTKKEINYDKVIELEILSKKPRIQLTNNKIPENAKPSTIVGNLDPINFSKGTVSFSLVDGEGADDNDKFEIVENSLISKTSFDLDVDKETLSIRVKATDQKNKTVEKVIEIKVVEDNRTNKQIEMYEIAEIYEQLRKPILEEWKRKLSEGVKPYKSEKEEEQEEIKKIFKELWKKQTDEWYKEKTWPDQNVRNSVMRELENKAKQIFVEKVNKELDDLEQSGENKWDEEVEETTFSNTQLRKIFRGLWDKAREIFKKQVEDDYSKREFYLIDKKQNEKAEEIINKDVAEVMSEQKPKRRGRPKKNP